MSPEAQAPPASGYSWRNITLIEGDITSADVDAIVNAANQGMLGGSGVDGAIHRAAGPALLQACREVKAINGIRCPTGEARRTSGGKLLAPYVIHTVGPIYAAESHPETLLASAYSNCLAVALSSDCQSIAFPAISCGIYGYPADEAARIAINICRQDKYRDLAIYFYLFGKHTRNAWQAALKGLK